MIQKILNRIESRRQSKSIFWIFFVILKDIAWKIIYFTFSHKFYLCLQEQCESDNPNEVVGFTQNNRKYSKYEIGRYSYGEPQVLEWEEGAKLKIGSFCSIADEVVIFLGGNHRPDWVTTYPFNWVFKEFDNIKGHPATKGNVVIGNDVWVGRGACILSGITIGDGAVIGANTVVTKSVDPFAVVVGNPGKMVKKRFSDEIVKKLLSIQWWNWDIQKIKEHIPLMLDNDIEKFIQEVER